MLLLLILLGHVILQYSATRVKSNPYGIGARRAGDTRPRLCRRLNEIIHVNQLPRLWTRPSRDSWLRTITPGSTMSADTGMPNYTRGSGKVLTMKLLFRRRMAGGRTRTDASSMIPTIAPADRLVFTRQ